ncbi:hypothetical protein MMC17_001050 [Xylographa soralifera]|nr:hypothetical protein [Xylographa soralifera]
MPLVGGLEVKPDGSLGLAEARQPTLQKSIVDPRDEHPYDQNQARSGPFDPVPEILVLAHRNNMTGVVNFFLDEDMLFCMEHLVDSPLLQQIQSDRANALVQASQGPQRSRSLQERRSKRYEKQAARRR